MLAKLDQVLKRYKTGMLANVVQCLPTVNERAVDLPTFCGRSEVG